MKVQKLGCIACSLVGAWLLLQPPVKPGPYPSNFEPSDVIIENAPLSEWSSKAEFESREACEAFRQELQDRAEAETPDQVPVCKA